jgi:hypothetical protein
MACPECLSDIQIAELETEHERLTVQVEVFKGQVKTLADLAASMHVALGKKVDQVERLTRERDEALKALKAVEWCDQIYENDKLFNEYCPLCENPVGLGHKTDCLIGITLARTQPTPVSEEPEIKDR